jgi:hypothetical protein
MSVDLIKRLREYSGGDALIDEAADLIESQARRIGELENALREAQNAMRAPLDGWKGEVERAALDTAATALSAERASP